MNDNQYDFNIGKRIRVLRKRMGLTLKDLSEISGLSINAISRIEKNLTSPTVSTVHRLAIALDTPLSSLFEEQVEKTVVHTKAENRQKMRMKGRLMEMLGTGLVDPLCEPFVVILEGGEKTTTGLFKHAGEEFAYCLEGRVVFTIDGEPYLLEEGDSLLFKSEQQHAWENPASHPARFVLIFMKSAPGEEDAENEHQIVDEYVKEN
jgi:transcriptional regulator with XRE-family HTH domain